MAVHVRAHHADEMPWGPGEAARQPGAHARASCAGEAADGLSRGRPPQSPPVLRHPLASRYSPQRTPTQSRLTTACPSRMPRLLAGAPTGVRRAVRELGEGAAELLWPTRCAGCDAPGVLLCDACRARLPLIDQAHACPRCGAPFGRLVCTECTSCHADDEEAPPVPTRGPAVATPLLFPLPGPTGSALSTPEPAASDVAAVELLPLALDGVCCAGVLAWPLDVLVRTYKDAGERRIAPILADLLAQALRATRAFDVHAVDALAFVPATPAAFARRGFDHMEAVARHLAGQLGLPLHDVLARGGARDQRGLSRSGRLANAGDDVVCCASLDGASILLVDDVLTTGATLLACAQALRQAGASHVVGACVARAW